MKESNLCIMRTVVRRKKNGRNTEETLCFDVLGWVKEPTEPGRVERLWISSPEYQDGKPLTVFATRDQVFSC